MNESNQGMINLEFRQISDLNNLLPDIAAQKNITRLSLHGNRLKTLPKDLSMINHIEYLDISGNLFKGSIEDLISSLKTLPRLKELVITLNSSFDEIQVIKSLPDLEFLNGTKIIKEKIKFIGQNISGRDLLDQANGKNNISKASQSNLNIIDQRNEKYSRNSLNMTNNFPNTTFHETIEPSEIQAMLSIYDLLSMLKSNNDDRNLVKEELQTHLTNILMDLDANSSQLKHRLAREIHILKARFALVDIVFHNYLEILGEDKNDSFKKISQTMLGLFYNILTQICKGFIDLAIVMEPKSKSNIESLK